ncbi:MAG: hypothetical protein ABJA93_10250 [Sporichthyaceae bacterium]
MADVVPMPVDTSSVLADARGAGRAMRVTWHHEAGDAGLVVLSLWHDSECIGSFRLDAADVPALVTTLVEGLAVNRSTAGRFGSRHRAPVA